MMRHDSFRFFDPLGLNNLQTGVLGENPGLLSSLVTMMPQPQKTEFDPRNALMAGALSGLSDIILKRPLSNSPMQLMNFAQQRFDRDQARELQSQQQNFQNQIGMAQLMSTLQKAGMPVSQLGRIVHDTFNGTVSLDNITPQQMAKVEKNIERMNQSRGLSTADLNQVAADVKAGTVPTSDPRYAIWWMENSKPKTQFDPLSGTMVTTRPDLSLFPVPTESAVPDPLVPDPLVPDSVTPDSVTPDSVTPDSASSVESQNQSPAVEMGSSGGVEVEQIASPQLTSTERKDARQQKFQGETIVEDLNRLKGLANNYFKNPLDVRQRDRIGTLYGSIQIAYKEYAKLGVLTGPDMEIIENFINNPTNASTVLKNLSGVGDYNVQVDEAIQAFQRGINRLDKKLGIVSDQKPDRSSRVDEILSRGDE